MQEQSHNSKTQNIGKGYTMNKMNSIVHLLMHNTTHISNTLRYISNEQNAFSNTLAIRDVSCVLCHFSFYTRTTIINVNSVSANRIELPCAKYKIHDCVYVCTYICTTLHTNVQCCACALCMKSTPMHVKELLLSPVDQLQRWTLTGCRLPLKQAQEEVLKECPVHADHFTLTTVPVKRFLVKCKLFVVRDAKSRAVSFRVPHYPEQEHVPVGQWAQTAAKLLVPLLSVKCQCCSMH